MLDRRTLIASAGASLVLAGCGQGGGASATVLRVGSQKGGTKALMTAAGVLQGIDYTVEWAEFPAAQNLLEALGSHAIDVGLVGDAPFQFAYQSGSPIQAVSAHRTEPRPSEALAIVTSAQSSVRSLEDLRGKAIATGKGSIGHYLVLRVLDRAGWTTDDVKLVFLSPSDAAAALAAGSVAAWSTWVPYVPLALAQGGRVVVDGRDYVLGYTFEVANVAAIEKKREILSDFLGREAAALAWAASHLDEYGKVLAHETGLPPAVARIAVEKNARSAAPIDDRLIQEQRVVLDTFAHAGEVKASRPLSQAFLPGLLPAAPLAKAPA
ncbi:MAG: aliphatic sulfonate ABC transporter substrate-binding protein [Novosphingobium sp.]|nr:MAG: aliphatic sulfonate ABC transporter substrate-binding protein [Novosphingobium sp.]